MNDDFMNGFSKFSLIVSIVVIVALILYGAFMLFIDIGSWRSPKEGFINAQIISVQKVGFIWRSTEVYLKSSQQASNQYKFCVTNNELAEKIKTLSENPDKTYRFTYKNSFGYPRACDENTISVLRSVN